MKREYTNVKLPSEWRVGDYPQLYYYRLGPEAGEYAGYGLSVPKRLVNTNENQTLEDGRTVTTDKVILRATGHYTLKKKGAEKVLTAEEIVQALGACYKAEKAAPAAKKSAAQETQEASIPEELKALNGAFVDEELFSSDRGCVLQSKENDQFIIVGSDDYEYEMRDDDDGLFLKQEAIEEHCRAHRSGKKVFYDDFESAAQMLVGGESKAQSLLTEEEQRAIDAKYAALFEERDREYWDTIPTKEEFVKDHIREKNWAKYQSFKNDFAYEKSTPYPLRTNKQFVVWKFEYYDEKGNPRLKPAKMPYNAKSPEHRAQSNNPATWTDFETACKCARENKDVMGVGIMFARGLVGIDIDGCFDKATGKVSEMATEIIDGVNSYTEVSPSGTGVHILAFGEIPGRGMNNQSLGLEIYGTGRFFTLTGKLYENKFRVLRKKADTKTAIDSVIEKHFSYRQKFDAKPLEKIEPRFEDKELLDKISKGGIMGPRFERLRNALPPFILDEDKKPTTDVDRRYLRGDGTVDLSAIEGAFCKVLVFYGASPEQIDRIYRNEPLARDKWDRSCGSETYGQYCIRRAFAGQSKQYDAGYARQRKPVVADAE